MPSRPAFCTCSLCRVQTNNPRGARFASSSARAAHLASQSAQRRSSKALSARSSTHNATSSLPSGPQPPVSSSSSQPTPVPSLSQEPPAPSLFQGPPPSPSPQETLDAIQNQVFLSTLLHPDPDAGESALLERLDMGNHDSLPNVSIDDIVQSMGRLNLIDTQVDGGKSRDGDCIPDTLATSTQPSGKLFQRYPPRRERNHLNQRCLKALDDILDSIAAATTKIALPSQEVLSDAESTISKARMALRRLTRRTESVDKRRQKVVDALEALEASVLALRDTIPDIYQGPVEFDSSHHYEIPAEQHTPAAQVAIFLGIVCSVVIGVSRRAGDLIMGLVSLLVGLVSLKQDGGMDPLEKYTFNQIPTTISAALSNLELDGQVTIYAACPACHVTYKPHADTKSSRPVYPDRCSNIPNPGGSPCNEQLLTHGDDDPNLKKPIKPFVYHHFADYLAGLLSQHENVMDAACDDCVVSLKDDPPPHFRGFFDAQFIRNFRGPNSDHLFINRSGSEGRYLFALNIDFFNVEGMRTRGPKTSCGIISLSCLNLPIEIRHLPENMYLNVIPGPAEPQLTDINHYLRPLIDDMVISWDRGIRISKTPAHPDGRNTRAAVAAVVSDLPAARKASGLANHNSHFYCSVCSCFHLKTRGCTNYEDWTLRDPNQMRDAAEQWRDASASDRIKLFQANGIRWSELWRLPYWDPIRQLVVDPMHCLLLGLAQYHARELLELSSAAAMNSDAAVSAYDHHFSQPQVTEPGFNTEDVKNVSRIHRLLTSAIELDDELDNIEQGFSRLTKRLADCRFVALQFVCNDLHLDVRPDPNRRNPRFTTIQGPDGSQQQHWILQKRDLALSLVDWRRNKPLSSDHGKRFKITTPEVLQHVKDVIRDTATPSWLSYVPRNFGESAAGTLKADEWRTMFTVYIPIALVSLWGEGTTHPSPSVSKKLRDVLDNTMNLASAINIACLRTVTVDRANAYRNYIATWLGDLPTLYPPIAAHTNNHMAFHIFDFLFLFGPVSSWWCFPFERLIGQLQRQPQNHKFGQLESTILHSFLRAARLRRWLTREDCPAAITECKRLFDKAYAPRRNLDTSFYSPNYSLDEYFPEIRHANPEDQPCSRVPGDLRKLISGNILLRARYNHRGIVYTRSSTHLGNSLVSFYSNGIASDEVPGVIKYILKTGEGILFAVQRHLDVPSDFVDPFKPYPYVPAKIYRSALAELELVRVNWVVSHIARWAMSSEYVVVLSLSKD